MKEKILWFGLSFLLVAALILSSCGGAEGEQEEEEEEEEEETLEVYVPTASYGMNAGLPELGLSLTVPKYGGSITILETLTESAGSPMPVFGLGTGSVDQFALPISEKLIGADIYQYGAFGTGEFLFKDDAGTPLRYATGVLAEDWEITPEKVVIHIRPGVYWTGLSINPGVMEKRLYTADDYLFNIMRRLDPEAPSHGYFAGLDWITEPWEDNIYVEDKYTVVFNTNYFHSQWDSIIVGGSGRQIPPEFVEAGGDDWENLVGTGPWVMKEFVQGSHVKVARNPDYWRKAPILGKLYQVPFLDEMVMPMILDEATAVAALRTGTVDFFKGVTAPQVASLTETNPELLKISHVRMGDQGVIKFNLNNPPLDQLEVRRALHIGTDLESINRMLMDPDEIALRSPMGPGWPGFVPLEDLPETAQLLFEYNPDLARQMLDDAGVDNLKLSAITYSVRAPTAELLMDQWAQLGVELDLKVLDGAAFASIHYNPAVLLEDDIMVTSTVSHTPVFFTHTHLHTDGPRNAGGYSSAYVDERLEAAITEEDPEALRVMMEEAFVRIIEDAPVIPYGDSPVYIYWWPWLKNCFGEAWYYHRSADSFDWWLDEDLKESMGY